MRRGEKKKRSQAVILCALGSRGRLIWLQMKRGRTESEESGVREGVRGSDSVREGRGGYKRGV